uniref:Secreted protein n=1 Tax=Heterorhabditis bacteriophora TaxID=37862 RepID=A0A1I7X8U0_HETBA
MHIYYVLPLFCFIALVDGYVSPALYRRLFLKEGVPSNMIPEKEILQSQIAKLVNAFNFPASAGSSLFSNIVSTLSYSLINNSIMLPKMYTLN